MQEESRHRLPDLRLRAASADDLATLARLEAAAFDDPWPRSHLAGEMEHEDALVLLAEATGDGVDGDPPAAAVPVGYAAWRAAAGEAELLRLAVAPEGRRRGVASALLAAGDAALAAAGAEVCYLEVRAGNAGALAFYAAAGFHRLGRRRGYYADGGDALLLARAVRPPAAAAPRPPSP